MACFAASQETPIKTFFLPDGHKIVIKEVHSSPIVTIDTWVKTGTAMENEKNNGISHFLEHLMFKGTITHKNGEIEKMLESKGARFNAATSKDFTHYYITIASDYADTAIKLHADMMKNPAIPKEEMEKERKVVQEEIRRAKDNPQSILINNLFKLIFKEHPYKMDTLGPHSVIETISREETQTYFKEKYIPSNLITIIVGDIDTQKVMALLKESFDTGYKPQVKAITSKPIKEPDMLSPATKIQRGAYKSGYLFMGFKGVPISSIKENYALDLAASLLGGSQTSRLYQNLKEKQNLVTSISAGQYSLKDDSVFLISADFEPEKYQEVLIAIQEEIENFKNSPVSDKELKRVKTMAKRSFIYENESVEDIAQSLGYATAVGGSIDHYTKHLQYIESITVLDIQKAAQKYLDPSRMALSTLLPEETEVKNVVIDKKIIKNSARSKLKNGMVLITNQNTSNDIISMSIFLKGGSFFEPKPGTAALLSNTLLYGTKQRPYEELIKEIEDLGISISPKSAADYFEITCKSTKNDFNKAFEILIDVIKNPVFEEKYIEKNKLDILADLKKDKDHPLSVASQKFAEELYKGHPYGNVGAALEENIPTLTREDVLNYWSATFIPENMVVSVAGDVDHDKIARKLLAEFKASGKIPPTAAYSDKFIPLDSNKIIKSDFNSEAAWILMGWLVGNVQDDKELASFKVIDALLSGGLSSRLHETFREKQGLAYSVGSLYSPKRDKGHFALFIGAEPKNIELVKAKFLEEIELLKTQPLTPKELEETKNKIIGGYALSQETNQNKAQLMGKFEVIDKEFGFNYDFPDLINKVTSEDVLNTANKYFNHPYVLSVVAPQKKGKNSGKE